MFQKHQTKGMQWFGVVLAGCAVGALMACGPKEAKTPKTKKPMAGRQDKKSRTLTDTKIRMAVEGELLFDQAVNLNRIAVEVNDGIVELTGRVTNVLAKKRAARIAETVKGVRAVVNQLKVDPMEDLSDAAIQEAVSQALLQDPATRRYQLDLKVKDHVVTLGGTLGSWQQAQLAQKVAASVRGVKRIENDIVVRYDKSRTDAQIKDEVQKTLQWDALVGHGLINVKVRDGRVVLSGKVGSAAEKSRAIADAWVQGVKAVDADQVNIVDWARNTKRRQSEYVIKADAKIREAINDALVYDPRVLFFDVTPYVDSGVVTLRGTVDNLKAKHAAEQVARHTVGVIDVRNRIKVEAGTPSDEEIEHNIEAALNRDPYLQEEAISAAVADGEAKLNGAVDSYFEKGRAHEVASRIYGVEKIDNNLRVEDKNRPLVFDPYVDDYVVYGTGWYDYEPGHTFTPDYRIRAQVKDELWWSPFVSSDEITVSVDDGVVTLHGEVDTMRQWRAATEEAYEAGAVWVKNDLDVKSI